MVLIRHQLLGGLFVNLSTLSTAFPNQCRTFLNSAFLLIVISAHRAIFKVFQAFSTHCGVCLLQKLLLLLQHMEGQMGFQSFFQQCLVITVSVALVFTGCVSSRRMTCPFSDMTAYVFSVVRGGKSELTFDLPSMKANQSFTLFTSDFQILRVSLLSMITCFQNLSTLP